MKEIYKLIRTLGATPKYNGYHFVAEAVQVALEAPEDPIKVTKDIYPILARRFKSSPQNIEHSIRTVVKVCWGSNRDVLENVAGCPLDFKPTNSDFIDILANYLTQQKAS